MIIYKCDTNRKNKNGAFSLFAESQNGNSTVVQNLIDNKASIDQVLINGVTSRNIVVQNGHTTVVHLYIDNKYSG